MWHDDAAPRWSREARPGYGAAVHAGMVAAETPIVAVLDGDGSMDPRDLPRLVEELDRGADMAVGRRRPGPGVRWPWHARLGNAAVCWRLRSRHGLPVHDIAPMRVARRDAVLALGVTDRRSGYPLELLVRAAAANWKVVEHDVTYGSRTGGKSKVSGSVRGSFIAALDFWRAISDWIRGGRAGGGQGAGARAGEDAPRGEHRGRSGRRLRGGRAAGHLGRRRGRPGGGAHRRA